jgi:2-polyprenyl-6-methoxyphenol hydroxylase-like FAD-dependent oxidoreductase
MVAEPRVLVVGAGLAGLALCRALEAGRARVDLLELAPAPETGAGILLTGNALAALDALGLGEAVRDRGRAVSSVAFSDRAGETLFRLELPAAWPDFVCIHRARLREILLEAASPVTPRWGCTVDRIERGPGRVRVVDSQGGEGAYDLVVGADGVHSEVARLALDLSEAKPIEGFVGWRFLAPRPPALREPLYMLGNGRTLLLHPLADGEVYCGAGPVHAGALSEPGDARDALQEAFGDFGGPARDVLSGLDRETELIPTRYWHLERERWHAGRCVLIGDAAHACAPTLAQGGAMAFEDARVLAELVLSSRSPEEALPAFEARRRPRVALVQRESLARIQANQPMDDRRVALRNQVMRRVGRERLRSTWDALVTTTP